MSPILVAMGNPLLGEFTPSNLSLSRSSPRSSADMQVTNGEALLAKYNLKANDAVLAEGNQAEMCVYPVRERRTGAEVAERAQLRGPQDQPPGHLRRRRSRAERCSCCPGKLFSLTRRRRLPDRLNDSSTFSPTERPPTLEPLGQTLLLSSSAPPTPRRDSSARTRLSLSSPLEPAPSSSPATTGECEGPCSFSCGSWEGHVGPVADRLPDRKSVV